MSTTRLAVTSTALAALAVILTTAMTTQTAIADTALLITKKSSVSVPETLNRLEKALTTKGIKIFARVDHSAGGKSVDLELPPTELLIFGNPKLGTPLMQSARAIGIDLPMKALAWQDADGTVYLSYNNPDALKARHAIADRDAVFAKMTKALDAMTNKATGAESEKDAK
ncbi:MAG: DUF302 domain-containing protein [Pseudomonadota bacterium]